MSDFNKGMLPVPANDGLMQLRNQYTSYVADMAANGQQPLAFPEWVNVVRRGGKQMPAPAQQKLPNQPVKVGPQSEIANRLSEDKELAARRAAEAAAMKARADEWRANRAKLR